MLQSLTWCESNVRQIPVEAGQIEVEVMVVGVNFKDITITMGIVPDDKYNLWLECTARSGVTKFKIGDR